MSHFCEMSRFTHFDRHKILAPRRFQLFCTPDGKAGEGKKVVMKPWEFKAKDLEEMDLGERLIKEIKRDIAGDLD